MLLVGAALFLAPQAAGGWWPWALTPLTGQAVGAWLIGLDSRERTRRGRTPRSRPRLALVGNVVMGLLQLGALARFAGALQWGAGIRLYGLFLLSMVAVGFVNDYGGPGPTCEWNPPAPDWVIRMMRICGPRAGQRDVVPRRGREATRSQPVVAGQIVYRGRWPPEKAARAGTGINSSGERSSSARSGGSQASLERPPPVR